MEHDGVLDGGERLAHDQQVAVEVGRHYVLHHALLPHNAVYLARSATNTRHRHKTVTTITRIKKTRIFKLV